MTLYEGDCLKLLREIPDNSVSLVVTSPPNKKKKAYEEWRKLFNTWSEKYPKKAQELKVYQEKEIPADFIDKLLEAISEKAEATRVATARIILIHPVIPPVKRTLGFQRTIQGI